jgi:exosortase/archaeosortase family protein
MMRDDALRSEKSKETEVTLQNQSSFQIKPGLMETHQVLIALAAVTLMVLPFVTTFNELLTAILLSSQAYGWIQSYAVPIEGKMVAVILQYVFGMPTLVSESSLIVPGAIRVYISWNCIGWQSLILFGISLLTGLVGPYTLRSKTLCVLTGIQGTILVNLLRIASVILVAIYAGYPPAILFHDYGGTIIIVLWLVLFWHFAFNHILRPQSIPSPT